MVFFGVVAEGDVGGGTVEEGCSLIVDECSSHLVVSTPAVVSYERNTRERKSRLVGYALNKPELDQGE